MKIVHIVLLFMVLQLVMGCQKRLSNTEDYHPTLELSVQSIVGGQRLDLEVLKVGPEPIEIVGFCFSENPDFSIEENQALATSQDEYLYSHTYQNAFFEESGSYYFKAFATTEYGYVESNVVHVEQVEFLSSEAPCSVDEYKMYYTGFLPNFIGLNTMISESFDYIEYKHYIDGGPAVIGIQFRGQPATGIYTSRQSSIDLSSTEARIYVGMNGQTLNGGSIYVNHIQGNEYRVEACGVPFQLGGTTTALNANWVIKI